MNSIVKPILFVFLTAAVLPSYAATQTTVDTGTATNVTASSSQQEKSAAVEQKTVAPRHHYRHHHHHSHHHHWYCGCRHHCGYRCQSRNYFYHASCCNVNHCCRPRYC